MNMKRFLRKNAVLILVVLVIGIVAYNYTYTEAFQSTARVGGTCPGPLSMATLSGICPSGFTPNLTTGMCEKTKYFCNDPSKYTLTGRTCVNKTSSNIITDALFTVEQRNYTCPTGMVPAGNMRCVRTGTYRCPSGFTIMSGNNKCIKCPSGSRYLNGTTCTRYSNREKISGELKDLDCVVV